MIDEMQNLGFGIAQGMLEKLGQIEAMVVGITDDGAAITMAFEGETPGDYAIEEAVQILKKRHHVDQVLTIGFSEVPYSGIDARDIVVLTVRLGAETLSKFYRLIRDRLAGVVLALEFLFSTASNARAAC